MLVYASALRLGAVQCQCRSSQIYSEPFRRCALHRFALPRPAYAAHRLAMLCQRFAEHLNATPLLCLAPTRNASAVRRRSMLGHREAYLGYAMPLLRASTRVSAAHSLRVSSRSNASRCHAFALSGLAALCPRKAHLSYAMPVLCHCCATLCLASPFLCIGSPSQIIALLRHAMPCLCHSEHRSVCPSKPQHCCSGLLGAEAYHCESVLLQSISFLC